MLCRAQPILFKVTSNLMSQTTFSTIRQKLPPNGIIGERQPFRLWRPLNTQSLPPVPLTDTCGRLCLRIYVRMKMLRQSRYPPPKSLRLKGLHPVFVVYSIVFIYFNIIYSESKSQYIRRVTNLRGFLMRSLRSSSFLGGLIYRSSSISFLKR